MGIDSFKKDNNFIVYAKTGSESTKYNTNLNTKDWVIKVQELGAGEIVLNCMNQDGKRNGFDIDQIQYLDEFINVPLIASGGAGSARDFIDLFNKTNSSGGLAASIFHKDIITIKDLKDDLVKHKINIRKI